MAPKLQVEELPHPETAMRVLHVGDGEGSILPRNWLHEVGLVGPVSVDSLQAAQAYLDRERVDLVLVELTEALPESLTLLESLVLELPDLALIILTRDERTDLFEVLEMALVSEVIDRECVDLASLTSSIHRILDQRRSRILDRARALLGDWDKEHLENVLATTSDGIFVVDVIGQIVFANPGACKLLGVYGGRLRGHKINLPFDPRFWTEVELENGKVVDVRVDILQWDGKPAWLLAMREITQQTQVRDELIDLASELERANKQLAELAFMDPLTGTLNRRGVESRLVKDHHLGPDAGNKLVALEIDFDDFKQVNDRLGHAVGDKTLRMIAETLQDCLRPEELLARVGGDEFLVLLPRKDLDKGRQVAEKIRLAVNHLQLPLSGRNRGLTVSIGISEIPPYTYSIEDILALTGPALQRSKEGGKNMVSVEIHQVPAINISCDEPIDAAVDIRRLLLEDRGIRIVKQKILSLEDNEVVGFEFLSRGPAGVFENPLDFFRLAMEQGVLVAVDLRCMDACIQAAREVDGYSKYNINLFPSTIVGSPIDFLISKFADDGNLSRFCIEISEQQFLGDPSLLRGPIRALREAGIRVGIDDVGFGRSSMEGLIVLEPDVVKIDRKYVDGIARNAEVRLCLSRLVKVIHALGADPVAEGIENREDLEVLIDLGVEFGQGFYWGRPE
jgi:diguanylate cyclase (GGDEF)-like protein